TTMAQMRMGESWRIGIDAARKTKLVDGGVYSVSRNPIFVGIIATQLGLLLVIPNALTLLNFVLGVVLLNIQVRLEEEYLRTMHGEEYIAYTRRVRRWI
ncbi:MAG TPA: isoprenylcysteine carboxylmethyltransferase family protein, partial [Pyrinomonadaceae bacterium]